MLSLVIPGPIPSKKNSKNIFVKNGRTFVLSSKSHSEWHRIASQSLKITPRNVENVKLVLCTIYGKDRRVFDLSNKFESIADLLVDCGIISDDNYEILSKVFIEYGGIDKENPRAEVTLFTKMCSL